MLNPERWRTLSAHPSICGALRASPGYANRRLSQTKVAPGFDHTRPALGSGAKVASVGAVDNRHGFLGARFWGQVRAYSGRLKALQGEGGTSGETSQIAGKARYQAPFPGRIAAGRILHGKEGVDGSSPSEGFAKFPANRLVGLSIRPTLITRGHLRATFHVRTLFARSTSIRLKQRFAPSVTPSLP
jgi:hypothetical protein